MDSYSEKTSTTLEVLPSEKSEEGEPSNYLPNARNVFQPIRVRRPFCANYEMDGFFLAYGRYILLPVGMLFWLIFLLA
jgi:hypothetical protein